MLPAVWLYKFSTPPENVNLVRLVFFIDGYSSLVQANIGVNLPLFTMNNAWSDWIEILPPYEQLSFQLCFILFQSTCFWPVFLLIFKLQRYQLTCYPLFFDTISKTFFDNFLIFFFTDIFIGIFRRFSQSELVQLQLIWYFIKLQSHTNFQNVFFHIFFYLSGIKSRKNRS